MNVERFTNDWVDPPRWLLYYKLVHILISQSSFFFVYAAKYWKIANEG